MFVIDLSKMAMDDVRHAHLILSYYNVVAEFYSDGEKPNSCYMVVKGNPIMGDHEQDALHLAEMAFQMNHHQENGMLCRHCRDDIEKTGEGESTCGHLTFTRFINSSFTA